LQSPFAPGLLIAPPNLSDPSFRNSVIALASHEPEGAMGYIISRPTQITIYELLSDLSITPKIKNKKVLFGGPVSRNSGFVVYKHKKNKPLGPGISINSNMSISPAREVLEMATQGKLRNHFELILGYAGWGPNQLDQELKTGGWLHTPFYPEILFDVPIFERWAYVFERLGVSPLGFMSVKGGAQA